MTNEKPIKIVVLGEAGVGKTTLIKSFIKKRFFGETRTTIALEFHRHYVEVDGLTYDLQIWDFAGQEHFREMGLFKKYCLGAEGAFLCFDCTNIQTLISLSQWVAFIGLGVPKVLVGTKQDLFPYVQESLDLNHYERQYDCKSSHFCSSKNYDSLNVVMEDLIGRIVGKRDLEKIVTITDNEDPLKGTSLSKVIPISKLAISKEEE